MTVSLVKLTKAELIDRVQVAENRPAATWSDVRTLALQTAATIRKEVPLFVKDCYRLGQWLRSEVTFVVEEMRKPILR